jgi:glycosyltransferase involved in cell wall biosynthesis
MVRNAEKSKISIVVPTYNHAHFLEKCLKSISSQTYENWEAIIINNYSEDNTIEVVKRFEDPRIQLINFRNNGIIAASRNTGIRHSSGDYIAFIDSDDWWYPNKLELVSKLLHRCDLIFHALDIYTPKGKRIIRKVRGRNLKSPVFVDLMMRGNPIANSSVVVRKELIDKVGGLGEDKSLVAVEDFDLWLKISRVTERFCYLSDSLGGYWLGEQSMTEVSARQVDRIKAIYLRFLQDRLIESRRYTLNISHNCRTKSENKQKWS